MSYAIQVNEYGGPEVLAWSKVDVGAPPAGWVRLRQTAVGVNFMEITQRKGRSPFPLPIPGGIGTEAAGVVEAVGDGVEEFHVGDRVAYGGGPPGAYAESRTVPANILVKIPDGITDAQAAAIMLKGLTAQALVRQLYTAKKGDFVLYHAVTSGVGTIACQWLAHMGVNVIGTVSTDEKAEVARANGCAYPIVRTREDFVEQVTKITGGKMVPIVFDSVGKETFLKSLECLAPRGTLAIYGQASGPIGPIDLGLLVKNSLFLTRAGLGAYASPRPNLLNAANDLFQAVSSGVITVKMRTYPLREAASAHQAVENRETTGSTVLVV
ncbi:MAG: quinone oxidoreductase [Hyphomonadaceae bacterium]